MAPILENIPVMEFLLAGCFVSIALIVFFQYSSMQDKILKQQINVVEPIKQCVYNNLLQLNDNYICLEGDNAGSLFYTTGDSTPITYLLSRFPKNYIDVCKDQCTGTFNQKLGTCEGGGSNDYNNCVKLIRPPSGCGDLSKPLGYRIDKNTKNKIQYYPKNKINNCK